jgi:hypothetical protein
MGGNSRRLSAAVDARRARVASYKVRGFSIRQTAAALAGDGVLNPSTKKPWSIKVICEDLQELAARWQADAKRDVGEHQARELERLDEMERQAWAAWHRGIGKKQQTFTERRDGGRGGGGSKASVRTEDLNGDPRFLQVLLDCQERRAKLLGLDAPTRIDAQLAGSGVMLIPVSGSIDDWEKEAMAAQAKLKAEVRGA